MAENAPDPLYDAALALMREHRKVSISLVQRHLQIGYNRAARLVEDMEKAGMVTSMGADGSRDLVTGGEPVTAADVEPALPAADGNVVQGTFGAKATSKPRRKKADAADTPPSPTSSANASTSGIGEGKPAVST